jgi:hypothetical protein
MDMGMSLHITADKREINDFPKLPPATSFICETEPTRRGNETLCF